MTQTAHVVDGIVREILIAPDGLTLDAIYPEAMLAECIDAPDTVQQGWTYDGKTFAAPPPAAAPPVDLAAYAASARYAKETAGITVGTSQVATDRDSQALITGMWAAAQINPDISVAFKSASGFVTINAAQVAKIATAVANHVQACFSAEAQVGQGITGGTIKTTSDIDAAFAAVTA